jgi:hypothetical protein
MAPPSTVQLSPSAAPSWLQFHEAFESCRLCPERVRFSCGRDESSSAVRADGRETVRELRREHGGLPVILCSGYDVLDRADRFAGLDFSGYLQKPYRLEDLVQSLRRALGG